MKNICLITIFLITLSCSSQNSVNKLPGTKWKSNHLDDCVYTFEGDRFTFIDCETGDTILGTYFLKGDTLIAEHNVSIYDEDFSKDSRHRLKPYRIAFIFNNSQMKPLYRESILGEFWVKSSFEFEDDYYFQKVINK